MKESMNPNETNVGALLAMAFFKEEEGELPQAREYYQKVVECAKEGDEAALCSLIDVAEFRERMLRKKLIEQLAGGPLGGGGGGARKSVLGAFGGAGGAAGLLGGVGKAGSPGATQHEVDKGLVNKNVNAFKKRMSVVAERSSEALVTTVRN